MSPTTIRVFRLGGANGVCPTPQETLCVLRVSVVYLPYVDSGWPIVKRRILQIIPTLDRAGAEKQMAMLAGHLPRDEFDVRVCSLSRGGPLESELRQAGVPTTVIGKRWKADPLAWSRLRRHIARLRPDLVHTWLFAPNAYGRAAARRAGVERIVAGERGVELRRSRMARLVGLLDSLSPLGVLTRGYALVRREADGRILRDAEQAEAGDPLEILLGRGELRATDVGTSAARGGDRSS